MEPVKVNALFDDVAASLIGSAKGYYSLATNDDGSKSITHWEYDPPISIPSDAEVEAALAGLAWQQYQAGAQTALDASDLVAIRCVKAGVPFPAEWQTYCNALRAIMRAPSGDPTQALPSKPEYPSGT